MEKWNSTKAKELASSNILYFFLVLVLLIQSLTICGQSELSITHLYNDPEAFASPKSMTLSNIGQSLLDLIDSANSSIDFAIYGIRNQPEIIESLKRAQQRGVVVRGVLDADVHGDNYYMDIGQFTQIFPQTRTDQASDLRQHSKKKFVSHPYWPVPFGFHGPPSCVGYTTELGKALIGVQASRELIKNEGEIMHNKFFVFDNLSVWTGSCNLSDSGTGGYNANTASVICSGGLARWFTREFEQMYSQGLFHNEKVRAERFDGYVGRVRVQAFSSPKSRTIREEILPILRNAEKEILIAVFFLTHKDITAELIRAHQRGVNVRIIMDATGAKNEYTKFQFLREAGIPVKIENWGSKMHCKAAEIDREIFVTGSMNWTSAGEYQNDENSLIFYDAQSANGFRVKFIEWWNLIDDHWLSDRPDPESQYSGTSCFDGVDNDFDNLSDEDDPGCSTNPPALPSLCPLKLVNLEDGNDLIKGNINSAGKKYYFVPTNPFYSRTVISLDKGERWFASPAEARMWGWSSPPGRR